MKHHTTQSLYDYWQMLRGERAAPERSEIDPADIRGLLRDTFLLEVIDRQTYAFRLAGTRTCSIYGKERKASNILADWSGHDHETMASLLATVSDDAAAAVVGFEGYAENGHMEPFELLLLPLRHRGQTHSRILGSLTPLSRNWIGYYPVRHQKITSMRLIWPDETPHFLSSGSPTHARPAPATRQQAVYRPAVAAIEEKPLFTYQAARRVKHLSVIEGGRQE